ncbi:Thbs4 [Lemmus lemmus]
MPAPRAAAFLLLHLVLQPWQRAGAQATPQVFDLLPSSSQRLNPGALQPILTDPTLHEIYLIFTFKLQSKSSATIFGLYSSSDNSKYFEFTVMGRLNKAILRYLKKDGKIHLVVFNNLQLADGRRHRILLRLSNLQKEAGSIDLYLDCAQVDSVRGLPRAFSGLARNPESIELRTFQRKPQDFLEELKLVLRGSLFQVASLQDCFLQQSEPLAATSTGDFNRQFLGQMTQLNQLLGEVKDLLRQQVKETSFLRNTIAECQACGPLSFQSPTPNTLVPIAPPAPPTRPTRRCDSNPCFRGVRCTDTRDGFQCGPCPDGYTGNGITCSDVDECKYNPCYPGVRCVNLAPGYRCDACPVGFTGPMVQGVGVNFAKTNKQVCTDVDECRNGACVLNSVCINTLGSYRCGPCKPGYTGDQTRGCKTERNCRNPELNPCSVNAQCIEERQGDVTCVVSS